MNNKLLVATHLKSGFGLDLLDHSIRQRLVKLRGQDGSTIVGEHDVEHGVADLLEDLHGQLGGNRTAGN